jgi:phosphoglycerate dehydrogenase-like enzyme
MPNFTTTQPKILIVKSTGFSQSQCDEVAQTFTTAEFVFPDDTADAIASALPGVHAIINCPRPLFGPQILAGAGNHLKWIHVGGAGCEQFLISELVNSEVTLTNGKIIQGPEVADHAFALLLCLTRNIHLVERGQSVREMPRPIELYDKTLAVIGAGGIGLLVAERSRAFGMDVIAITPEFVPMLPSIRKFCPPDRMHEVLGEADVVVMAAPHTKDSYQMMARTEFQAMKKSAIYISVSRGANTDTEALVEALQNGEIAAAGLDVTDPEPLPEEHPLRQLQNVVLTPHIAGPSDQNRKRSFDLIIDNIGRFINGHHLYNIVDKQRGW